MKLKQITNLNRYLFVVKLQTHVRYIKFVTLKFALITFSLFGMQNLVAILWPRTVKLYSLYKNKYFTKHHDKILSKIAYRYSNNLNIAVNNSPLNKQNILYLASNINDIGGHTRVLHDFISYQDIQKYKLFLYLTEINENHNSKKTQTYNRLQPYLTHIQLSTAKRNKTIDKTTELINYVTTYKISTIVLFEHAWDLVILSSIVKLKKETNIKVIYYHHQNLHLTVFPNIMDVYIEITDGALFRVKKTYDKAQFMEIPMIINHNEFEENTLSPKHLTLMTAIPFRKMFVNNSKVFPDLVIQILKYCPEWRYLIVTYKNDKWINLLNEYFAKKGVHDRVQIIDSVNNLSSLKNKFDIYIDGLPIGGGKTIIEIMSINKACIILEDKRTLIRQSNSLNFIKVYNFKELVCRISKLKIDEEYKNKYIAQSTNILTNCFNPIQIMQKFERIIDNL